MASVTNFESGPLRQNGRDDTPLRWEKAAKRVTVKGWACRRCGRFFGNDERAARYCCHTDAPCESCGGRKSRHEVKCSSCWAKELDARYVGLAQRATDWKSPLVGYEGDTYFFDLDELLEHAAQHGMKPSEMHLVHARPNSGRTFSLNEFLCDDLPEDGEVSGPDAASVEKAVNDYINSLGVLSWWHDYKVRPTDAELSDWDAKLAEEAGDL